MLRLRVSKARWQLWLFDEERLLFSCPVGLGRSPLGHKQREGDGRTPEGCYRICTRNAQSRFHLALGISYPNAADARAALARGEIMHAQAEAISAAEAAGQRPPWDTPLGGQIMHHGQKPGAESQACQDWTAGCINLADPDMEQLWELCPLGTEIEILP